jgi:hypothetical protein
MDGDCRVAGHSAKARKKSRMMFRPGNKDAKPYHAGNPAFSQILQKGSTMMTEINTARRKPTMIISCKCAGSPNIEIRRLPKRHPLTTSSYFGAVVFTSA